MQHNDSANTSIGVLVSREISLHLYSKQLYRVQGFLERKIKNIKQPTKYLLLDLTLSQWSFYKAKKLFHNMAKYIV